MKKIYLCLFVVLLTTTSLVGCVKTLPSKIMVQNETNGITVSAKEKVKVIPDKAEISFSVYTESEKAENCEKENMNKINNIIAELKTLGFEEKQIQTSEYNLSPKYEWINSQNKMIGYSMNTKITLTNVEIKDVGNILSKSINLGINNINNIRYFSSKFDECYNEALKLAIVSAKEKANIIAQASNTTISDVLNIKEEYFNDYAKFSSNSYYKTESISMDNETGFNVEPGEIEVEAQVIITYRLN